MTALHGEAQGLGRAGRSASHRHLTTTQRSMHLSPSALQDAITLLERNEHDPNQPASKRKLETGWRRGSSEEEGE